MCRLWAFFSVAVSRVWIWGLKGFGVVRWGGMEEEVDYTLDGVNERYIFVVGGFSGALDRQGTSGPLLSGRGPGVYPGHMDEVGLAGHEARLSNPRISSPNSVVLKGLEADLALFKTTEGLGVDRPDLAGLLGRTLSPQNGCFANFPANSSELPVEGLSPFLGGGIKHQGLEGDFGSFSVGALVVSEAGRGLDTTLGTRGREISRAAISSSGQAAAALGSHELFPEAESFLAPKQGGSAKEGSQKGPKVVKDRKRRDKLVLGVDVSMEEAEDLSLTAVVGHVRGKRFGRGFLRRWAAEQWKHLLDSTPEVRVLTKGWFSFILHNKGEVDAVLGRQWSMHGVPIVLKSWTTFFD